MSRPIYEPDPEAKIATNKFGVKDLRNRPLASRWYEPDCSGGVDCDGDEPTLTWGNFSQPTAQPFGVDIEKFAYRFSKDGSLQTKGILDASGASSGDYAFTLPGVGDPDNEVYSIPNSNPNAPTDQAFALRVTTTGDDSGTTPATGYVDSTTGDVYVRWSSSGTTEIKSIVATSTNVQTLTPGNSDVLWQVNNNRNPECFLPRNDDFDPDYNIIHILEDGVYTARFRSTANTDSAWGQHNVSLGMYRYDIDLLDSKTWPMDSTNGFNDASYSWTFEMQAASGSQFEFQFINFHPPIPGTDDEILLYDLEIAVYKWPGSISL